jgi:hypothetical protein
MILFPRSPASSATTSPPFEAQLSICGDLVSQFPLASEVGRQFSDSWFAAGQVLDLGRRASKLNPPAPPNP